jgi:toxin ParE1/3/4
MNLRWSRQALTDLRSIREYIAREDPGSAVVMLTRLRIATNLLVEYPHVGRVGQLVDTRELIVSRTSYIVVYRLRGDVVVILRVRHGAQDRPAQD